ncbi:MAG: hypothetical protein QOJ62_304 [Actinomycetota bacterium]|jgi:hypothetical protein|nr:hypothetical protein [Actinomycetota bacterium]
MQVSAQAVLAVNLNHPGRYVHWGVVQISVANLVVILLMIALFAAAILLPFPGRGRRK